MVGETLKLKLKDIEEEIKHLDRYSALEELLFLQGQYGTSLEKLIIKYQKKKAASRYSGIQKLDYYIYKFQVFSQ
jgi:hypothetical protein